MACRKNAYRGLMDMADHLEKQREESARRQRAFEEEQRQKWTPPSVLEKCCLQWLAHGPHQVVLDGPSSSASTKFRGCSGVCGKEHPVILLAFEDGVATASISHAFDPLMQYFEELPTATQKGPLQYRLTGLLANHYDSLKQKFGAHLVSVSPICMSASQRSDEKRLQQEYEQAQKRRRVSGPSASTALLEGALEIAFNHSLSELLDVADIAWMRMSCKTLAKVASWMARDRMKEVELSYRPSVPTCIHEGDVMSLSYKLAPCFRRHLQQSATDTFCPGEPQMPISWDFRGIGLDDTMDTAVLRTMPVQIEIILEKSAAAERDVLCGQGDLEVARFEIVVETIRETQGAFNAPSNVQSRTEKEGSLRYIVSNGIMRDCQLYGPPALDAGEITVRSVNFTFNDLLGVYVRKRLSLSKKAFNASSVKKPSDKAYVKALAKAAREAPGNADSFRRMSGWQDVYNTT